jgi:hypothetical protein
MEGGRHTDLREKFVHLATCAVLNFALFTVVFVTKEVIAKEGIMRETLKNNV